MSKVILRIVPMYADAIFDGTKKVEFRRKVWKDPNIRRVIVYSSSPIKQIIGEFEIDRIIRGEKEEIWDMFKDDEYIGTTREAFDFYIQSDECVAIKIGKLFPYKEPKSLEDFGLITPPQSFVYLNYGIKDLEQLEF